MRTFRGHLGGYNVMWGLRLKHRPKKYFIFVNIQEQDRVIRINRALDQPFVPSWFLRYVLYHEMLHSVVPDEALSRGRRRALTEAVNRPARTLSSYPRARRFARSSLSPLCF